LTQLVGNSICVGPLNSLVIPLSKIIVAGSPINIKDICCQCGCFTRLLFFLEWLFCVIM